mmetsp:Transcript_9131/g.12259  ORF Transcript_9131/g.12259 Transcript_9131/m.12259 type:complete len:446 (+) Transcript_9131:71-1408(+)
MSQNAYVCVVEGKELIACDDTGKSDPFVNVLVIKTSGRHRQIFQTEVIDQNLTPVWNETVRIKHAYLSSDSVVSIRFDLFDRDPFKNDYMGHVELPVAKFKESFDEWFDVKPKPGKSASTVSGKLHLRNIVGGECSGLHKRASELIAKGKFAEAVPILRQASEGGDVGAQRDLAILLKDGKGHEVDLFGARKLFGIAAKNGDAVSENNLGYMKQHGIGGTKNLSEARDHFEGAAPTDLPAAIYNLGYAYFTGLGGTQDYENAREYFEMASIAKFPPAINNLGFCYQFGIGGEKNEEIALQHYKTAAEANYAPAMVNLAQYLQFIKGGEEDIQQAVNLYEKACKTDPNYAQAWFCFALCLEEGIGLSKDTIAARAAYAKAAKFGEPEGQKAVDRLDTKIPRVPRKLRKGPSRGGLLITEAGKELDVPKATKGHKRTRSMGGQKPKP